MAKFCFVLVQNALASLFSCFDLSSAPALERRKTMWPPKEMRSGCLALKLHHPAIRSKVLMLGGVHSNQATRNRRRLWLPRLGKTIPVWPSLLNQAQIVSKTGDRFYSEERQLTLFNLNNGRLYTRNFASLLLAVVYVPMGPGNGTSYLTHRPIFT